MHYTYEYNGATYTLQLERQPDGTLRAVIDDTEYGVTASQIADGSWLLHLNSERFIVHTAADKAARYVQLNGTQFKLDKLESRRRSSSIAARGDLTATMPGQVLDVRVAIGDTVQAGDVLVVLEAMKMEIRIAAPQAGVVAEVLVTIGLIVDRGQRLIALK
jgi:biotin carboxyl carrier protein